MATVPSLAMVTQGFMTAPLLVAVAPRIADRCSGPSNPSENAERQAGGADHERASADLLAFR